jgi:rhodanese-related sulfurtransferase
MMNPWIQNVALSDIRKGHHIDAGINSMLIQICDPPGDFPTPSYQFKEVHQFQFLDVEEKDEVLEEAMKCSQEQANELVRLLQHAFDNRMNVVVHCHAGVCRSGAVCEIGVMMGFRDTEAFRSPNLLVKHRMMRALGWLYDEQEQHSINGVTLPSGIIVPSKTIDWTNNNEKVFTLARARRERREQEGDV